MPAFYPENNTSLVTDSEQRSLHKVVDLLNNGSGAGSLTGAGSPEGVTNGRVGQHYWDTTNRIDYIKTSGTGNTGWEIFLGI